MAEDVILRLKLKDKDYRKRAAIERINSRLKLDFGLDGLKLSFSKAAFHTFSVIESMLFAAGLCLIWVQGLQENRKLLTSGLSSKDEFHPATALLELKKNLF